MTQEERLDYLVKALCEDSVQYKNLEFEKNEKRNIMRSLMNIRMPKSISCEFLMIQNDFLKQEALDKGVVSWREIPDVCEEYGSKYKYGNRISIWKGDITRLQVDAIVNAANSQMLGCFVPCHKCIDNAIHSAAGIELREECNQYMIQKRKNNRFYEEPTGSAVVTKAYNLPCSQVIHTVGPIVPDKLTASLKNELRSCYKACLESAIYNGIRTIAFCCISTGEFRFPNKEAAEIAFTVIQDFLAANFDKIDRIIVNVFKDVDLEIYEQLAIGR